MPVSEEASLVTPVVTDNTLHPTHSLELEKSRTSEAPSTEYDPTTFTKPYSPFYIHPSARPSLERSSSANRIEVGGEANDLEAGLATKQSSDAFGKREDGGAVKEGVPRFPWPRSRSGKNNKKQGMTWPKARRCNCLAGLPKWQRITIKLAIALLIVGAIVGIAVGISIAVHGSVYKNSNSTIPIGG